MSAPVSGDMDDIRRIFAEELDFIGEKGLAEMVRSGRDNSHGGLAAIRAMQRLRALPSVAPDYEAAFQVWAGWQASRQRGDGQKMIKAIVNASLTVKE